MIANRKILSREDVIVVCEEEKKPRGFWSSFFEWWRTPYSPWSHFSRTDPRLMLILVIFGICGLIFAPKKDKIAGAILIWYIFTIIVPAVWGERLVRRFGTKWGMILSYALLWVPILLGLTAGLWLPLFGIH
jgi:hypothetical protein